MAPTVTAAPASIHPLDPLRAAEIERAWEIVRAERPLGPRVRVIFVMLHEPDKKVVLGHRPGDRVDRAAFVVLIDSAAGKTYEAIVSLGEGRVLSWEHVPGAQPAIVLDEFVECEAAVRADPRWREALRRRGVTDPSLAMVDCWSAGNFGFPADEGHRLVRALTWVRRHAGDNGYARPVANLLTVVDLDRMEVLAVEDGGVVPLPPEDANYSPEAAGVRAGLKPIEIRQPEGPSFTLAGHELSWQKWRMRIGFTPREGLVIHTVSYEDQGRERPVLYRASIADMVVPYGDPRPTYFHRNAFDVGEYGIGTLANSLVNGCDCLGEIRYLDAVVNDGRGARGDPAQRDLPARGGRGHPLEARGLAARHHRGAPLAPPGRLVHLHRRQLRVRLLLVLLPGRDHPARGQDDRRHLERRRAAGLEAPVGGDGRARGLRADPPALLQRPPRHDGGRARELGLRGEHGGRPPGARQPARQRLPRRVDACSGRRRRRSGSSIRSRAASGRSPTRRRATGWASRWPTS